MQGSSYERSRARKVAQKKKRESENKSRPREEGKRADAFNGSAYGWREDENLFALRDGCPN